MVFTPKKLVWHGFVCLKEVLKWEEAGHRTGPASSHVLS